MSATDWLQAGSLVIAAITLFFLFKYVAYTKTIAEQAAAQTEALNKPAVIAMHAGSINSPPTLRNIGKGPALDLAWEVTGTKHQGMVSYLEPEGEKIIGLRGMQPLYDGAAQVHPTAVAIACSYKSISGRKYVSTSLYDCDADRFSTSFEEVG